MELTGCVKLRFFGNTRVVFGERVMFFGSNFEGRKSDPKMISRLQSYAVGRLLHLKSSLFQYATAVVAGESQSHFMVAHLENLLGFSREDAISATKKVNQKSSKKDPSLVISFLESLGLDRAQIKSLASSDPRFLLYDLDKTLKPKIRIFQDLGFSPFELKKLLVNNRFLLTSGANSGLKAPIELLRKYLGSDENVAKAVKRYAPLLQHGKMRNFEMNIELLKKIGIPDKKIVHFVHKSARRAAAEPYWLVGVMHKVVNEYGIDQKSKMFYYAVDLISASRQPTLDSKFRNFRSYGLTDEQIYGMFRTLPYVFGMSKDKIRETAGFFEGLGYSIDYLASRPVLFCLSLDKRVKPRCELLKVLKEKNLIKKMPQALSFLLVPESKFVSCFLLPYKDEIPDVYQSYIKSVGRQKLKTV